MEETKSTEEKATPQQVEASEKRQPLQDYKEHTLLPAVYNNLPRVFPEMHFTQNTGTAGGWKSKYHLSGVKDGEKSKSAPSYITYVYANNRASAIDTSDGARSSLVDLYMLLHGKDFKEALRGMAEACGAPPYQFGPQDREALEKNEALQHLHSLCKEAIFSPEGEAVLAYMNGRGWSPEMIKEVGIGALTPSVVQSLTDKEKHLAGLLGGIEATHPLAIPYTQGSSLVGMKWRRIDAVKKGKYMNTDGLPRGAAFFKISHGLRDIVVVEGDLDCLHARVKGLQNVVGMGGKSISPLQVEDAIRRGVKSITLLLDNDEAGEGAIPKAIESIRSADKKHLLRIYVAELPTDEEEDARGHRYKPSKDVDEFLREHDAGAMREALEMAVSADLWTLETSYLTFQKEVEEATAEERDLPQRRRDEWLADCRDIVLNSRDRGPLYAFLENIAGEMALDLDQFYRLEEQAAEQKEREEEATKSKLRGAFLKTAGLLLEAGKVEEAEKALKQAEALASSVEEKYRIKVAGYYEKMAKNPPRGRFPLNYSLIGDKGEHRAFLPLSAVSAMIAKSGHGKTTALLNACVSALDSCHGDERVICFTIEKEETDMLKRLCSVYAGRKSNPMGFPMQLEEAEAEIDRLMLRGRLLTDRQGDIHKILSAVRAEGESHEVKAVFIDYMQILRITGFKGNKKERMEEACLQLRDLALDLHCAVVVGAQISRECTMPTAISEEFIGDAVDIGQVCDTIYGFWDMAQHAIPMKGVTQAIADAAAIEDLRSLKITGASLGSYGKIFCKVCKTKDGKELPVNACNILTMGPDGAILPASPLPPSPPPAVEQTLPFMGGGTPTGTPTGGGSPYPSDDPLNGGGPIRDDSLPWYHN